MSPYKQAKSQGNSQFSVDSVLL